MEKEFGRRTFTGMELFVGDVSGVSLDGAGNGRFSGKVYGLSGRLVGATSGREVGLADNVLIVTLYWNRAERE